MKKICILSVDGGGIRGILPAVILSYIETELRRKINDNVRLSDCIDLFAGTSTGGILTGVLLTPNENNRPKFTATDALNLYIDYGSKIFYSDVKQKIKNLSGIVHAKYSSTELENILNQYLSGITMSKLLKDCIITSYDITRRKTIFFSKIDAINNKNKDFFLRNVIRSTTAAPTYFKPSKIQMNEDKYYLIDGGVFANNPSMCAYAEARTLNFPNKINNPSAKEMVIISIGCGSVKKPYPYKKAKKWGAIGWIMPLIDVLMSGNAETIHYQLQQLFKTTEPEKNYYRLEPKIYPANPAMDDASKENIEKLVLSGKEYVFDNKTLLDNIVDILIENK